MQFTRSPWKSILWTCVLIGVAQLAFAQSTTNATRVSLPASVGADWWQTAQAEIAQAEYGITWQGSTVHVDLVGAYQAPNRAHNFRTYFTPDGLRLIPRAVASDDAPPWELELRLSSFGRVGATQPVETAALHTIGNRIEYRRGDIVEWYVNDERGLEQGFTIAREPERTDREALLTVNMELSGGVSASLDDDWDVVDILAAGGARAIRLSHLHVFDANGCEFAAWFEVGEHVDPCAPQRLSIVVDDRGASYPLTIDPLATSPAWSAQSNQTNAALGFSVACAGDVNGDGFSDVIVGAYLFDNGQTDEGRAFVYHGSASGLSASPSWSDEPDQPGAQFGFSVSTAGDFNGDGYADVIVGAPGRDGALLDEGSVYTYLGSPNGLAGLAWVANGNQAGAALGASVACAGDVDADGYSDVVVGAFLVDIGAPDVGLAALLRGSANGTPASQTTLTAGQQANAQFGVSVASAGDVNGDGYSDVIVGANFFDNGQVDEGAAFLYLGWSGGLLTTPLWTTESNQAGASLGYSVASAGDVNADGYSDVIVGAFAYDSGQADEGFAWVYLGSATGPAATPTWTAESNQASAYFGASVASAGDVNGDGYADVIVGAFGHDASGADRGRAFVYLGSSNGLAASQFWEQSPSPSTALAGRSVASAGDVNGDGYSDIIVGAPGFDELLTNDQGAAFVYYGSASGLAAGADSTAESDQTWAFLGSSVSGAGDVNGDGFSDVIVGAYLFDNGQVNEGRAFVFHGSTSGLATTPAWTAESDQADAWFGWSVSNAGDVNGDGYSDVIVGSPDFDNGEPNEGSAFVYLGSPLGLAASAAAVLQPNQASAEFGMSVRFAGDVNADGYGDVIVGAHWFDGTTADEGRAFVWHGSASGLAASPAWMFGAGQAGAELGYAVSNAGDVNGDGYSDVIVGAPFFDNGEVSEGRAWLFQGSSSGLSNNPAWTAESNQAGALLAWSVSTAGDVDGDGYSDVIVGAASFDGGDTDEGRAFVWHGSASGLAASPAWTAESDNANAWFGHSVSSAGDVNGDGYFDVVVGAPFHNNPSSILGDAFVFHGSSSGLAANPAWTAVSDQSISFFGFSVSGAGDVNGDGYSDVVVGSPRYANPLLNEGRALIYYGNGGRGAQARPRQRRADDTAPIASLGAAPSSSFLAKLIARSPFGRADVRIAVEVKPLGVPFDGTGVVTSPLSDGGLLGFDAGVIASLSGSGTPHHWRARVLHNPITTPWLPAGPWFTPAANSATETDLRAPGLFCGFVTTYCTAGTTSNGCTATMSASGSPSLAASSGFVLTASGVEGQKLGLIFYGVSGANASVWAPGSSSVLCVKTPVQRSASQNSGGLANQCNGVISLDFLSYLSTHPTALGQPFAAGQSINAQCWFRDPASPGSTSLSDGLHVALCP